jgi:hypothetical protein
MAGLPHQVPASYFEPNPNLSRICIEATPEIFSHVSLYLPVRSYTKRGLAELGQLKERALVNEIWIRLRPQA